MKQFKRYLFFICMIVLTGVVVLINQETGMKAVNTTLFSLKEMLMIIPPIFVLLGLLDVWVPRETMIKFLGEGSGIRGMLISIFIGSAAAGPLYGAFPVALVLMKKGAKFSNVLLFLGAWSTTKIPMLLFEMSSLGLKFTLTRLAVSLVGIFVIAFIVEKLMSKKEVDELYNKASASE
ncbi:MAG: permease [Clostridiaceae bacterium]|nr:permease [Clostridiaceae bacterium]